jgi:DNA-binding transcriptional regulator YiaG
MIRALARVLNVRPKLVSEWNAGRKSRPSFELLSLVEVRSSTP